jgi:hypothetical protein
MTRIRTSREIDQDRRRFLSIVAMTVGSGNFSMVGSADPNPVRSQRPLFIPRPLQRNNAKRSAVGRCRRHDRAHGCTQDPESYRRWL